MRDITCGPHTFRADGSRLRYAPFGESDQIELHAGGIPSDIVELATREGDLEVITTTGVFRVIGIAQGPDRWCVIQVCWR